jgi:YegS/Rv2252/BmrU family lipid kinase
VSEPRRMLVIVNPQAKHGLTADLVPAVTELLGNSVPYDVVATDSPMHAALLAREASGYDTLVAVGGDGTAHEVLNGLMQRPAEDRPALGIVPTGSGNDYAHTLGIPDDLSRAVRLLATGTRTRVDVGVVNGIYFGNSMAMGFDAKVTARAVQMKVTTGRSGLPLYLSAMWDVMLHDFGSHHVRMRVDDGPETEIDVTLIAVTNGPTYGGGFKIVPMADHTDGKLDMLTIDALPLRGALWRFPFVVVGRHEWMSQTHFSRHTHVEVACDVPLPGQIDGEVMLADRYDIRVLPGAVEVVVGPEAAS